MHPRARNLPQALLQQLLDYDPETGTLKWKVDFGHHKAGTEAGRIHKRRKHGRAAVEINLGGFTYQAHNLIWSIVTGKQPENEVDHKNRDPADNRWENLREADRSQNQANTALYENNQSGRRGVHFIARLNRWRAIISVKGKNEHLGYFNTAEDAAAAWERRAQEIHGEFAMVRCA